MRRLECLSGFTLTVLSLFGGSLAPVAAAEIFRAQGELTGEVEESSAILQSRLTSSPG